MREGDVVSNISALAGTNYAVGNFNRVLTAVTGAVPITGVGFRPTFVMFFGAIASSNDACYIGGSDGTNERTLFTRADLGTSFHGNNNFALELALDGSNYQFGVINSFDVDGFTIGWTKVGTPTGTFAASYLAFK